MKFPGLLFSILLTLTLTVHAQVRVEALPEPGLQPQVALSTAGIVHLVYLKGDPKACDIRMTVRSSPVSWAILPVSR